MTETTIMPIVSVARRARCQLAVKVSKMKKVRATEAPTEDLRRRRS